MSEIALAKGIFPDDQIRDFLNRGLGHLAATTKAFVNLFRGRTYLEWYLYFKEQNFQPSLREAPIMAEVLLALYRGMVLQAEEASKNWSSLPLEERERYRKMALHLVNRERTPYRLAERIELIYTSVLVFHNFQQDIEEQDHLFDEFADIILSADQNAEEKEWREAEGFYDMLLKQIDEDLNRDYSSEELKAIERVQRRLDGEKADFT